MELLRELFKKYLGRLLGLLANAIVSILLSLLVIELGRRIINLISARPADGQGSYRLLMLYCCLMMLTVIAGASINYVLTVSFTRLSQSVLQDIRLKIFAHVLRLPQEFHNRNPVGVIMSMIMNDIGYIGQFLSRAFLVPIVNSVLVVFFTAYIFYLNWRLAVAAIIAVPFIAIVLPRLNRRLAKLSEDLSNSTGRISAYFQEALSAVGDIRSNQTYAFEESRLRGKMREFFAINVNLAKTSGALQFWMKLITQFGPFSIYLYGGFLCMRGELAVGSLIAAIGALSSLYSPVDSLVSFLQEWRQVKVRFDKLDGYLRLTPESEIVVRRGAQTALEAGVRFENVQFGFNEREMLLQDIRFAANPGERLAIVGTSGSGKSLTAALLSRIYNPLAGKIFVGGNDIGSVPLHDLRSRIGHVSQAPFLFNDSIRHNILYALLRKDGGDSSLVEEWIDFSRLRGIDTPDKLDGEIRRVVREVGLYEDVYELGLRSQLTGTDAEVKGGKAGILQARRLFMEETAAGGLPHVEHYEEDRFLEYCSLLENIIFCPSSAITEGFGNTKEFTRQWVNGELARLGLFDRIFTIGAHLACEDSLLLERLGKGSSSLLDSLGLTREEIDARVRVGTRMAFVGEEPALNRLDAETTADVLDLAYNYVPGRSKENLLGEAFRNDVLSARKFFRELMEKRMGERAGFFSRKDYIESASIRQNIVFGNIDPSRKKANETVGGLVRKAVAQAGAEDLVTACGLAFNVGERGSKLSGGQKQKVAIARILLKNPSILILDEATASLDSASQTLITDLVRKRFSEKTVISIAHRLNTIRDYDKILVFDRGQIVEQGAFEELIEKKGLFSRLFRESN